jgi:DegV family protein with EDD domain
MPTTSSITPGELLKAVEELSLEADAVVAILLSNELSSSVEAAEAVQQMVPDKSLYIVDSRTAAMAQGFVVLEAARAAAEGASVEEVINRAESVINRVYLYGVLETLKYLHRGGRIGSASLFLGSLLQLKPIAGILPGSGRAVGIARPRTWKGATAKLLDLMEVKVADRPLHVAVSHGDKEDAAVLIAQEIERRFNVRESHAGPVLALSFYADDDDGDY